MQSKAIFYIRRPIDFGVENGMRKIMLHSCAKMQVASNRPSLDWGDKLFCLEKVKKNSRVQVFHHAGDALAKFPTNAPSEVEEPVYTKSFNVAISIRRRSGDPVWSP